MGGGDVNENYASAETATLRELLELSVFQSVDNKPIDLLTLEFAPLPADAVVKGSTVCLPDPTATTIVSWTCTARLKDGWLQLKGGELDGAQLADLTEGLVAGLPG